MASPFETPLSTEDAWLTCPVCGTRFQATKNPACAHCPLHGGCQMACCPRCGTSVINPQASRWARWAERLFKRSPTPPKETPP